MLIVISYSFGNLVLSIAIFCSILLFLWKIIISFSDPKTSKDCGIKFHNLSLEKGN